MAKLKAHADKSAICSDLYNKVVLEKAILNKELKEIEQNFFFKKMKKIIPHRKNLICGIITIGSPSNLGIEALIISVLWQNSICVVIPFSKGFLQSTHSVATG